MYIFLFFLNTDTDRILNGYGSDIRRIQIKCKSKTEPTKHTEKGSLFNSWILNLCHRPFYFSCWLMVLIFCNTFHIYLFIYLFLFFFLQVLKFSKSAIDSLTVIPFFSSLNDKIIVFLKVLFTSMVRSIKRYDNRSSIGQCLHYGKG